MTPFPRRPLGMTSIQVTPVALGCWPIAGMTSIDVNDHDSTDTIRACLDNGINFLDTAYCYGASGESERLIRTGIKPHRDQFVIATKCGIHWDYQNRRIVDGRPEVLRRQVDESLNRLGTDHVELLYLHAPDPNTPIAESAGELRRICSSGKALSIGVSNVTLDQLRQFHAECPVAAVQPPYNMLQREIELDILPWCLDHQVSAIVYWALMKGLLAGQLRRDHRFAPNDGRAKYPMFQGDEWQRNQDFVDELRVIAAELNRTVAQVVVNWTIHQPAITAALCGAKRAYQINEAAGAMGWQLDATSRAKIDAALLRRGVVVTKGAV